MADLDTDVVPGGEPPAPRPFTNRHDLLDAFDRALEDVRPDEQCVLNFHGVGGIGKTWLLEHIDETRANGIGHAFAYHDFGSREPNALDSGHVLAALRTALTRSSKDKGETIPFPTFDLAFAHYWGLRSPHLSLREVKAPFLEEAGILTDLITATTRVDLVGLISAVPRALDRLGLWKPWWKKRGERDLALVRDLRRFEEVEPYLRVFFAADLRDWLAGHPSRRAVLLLDTHESFFETPTSGTAREEPDQWLRYLAAHLKGVVVAIAGRGVLQWPKREAGWADCIQFCDVDYFEPRYREEYLVACGVAEPDVRASMAEKSAGLPLYLSLAVRTCERIREAEDRPPRPDEFDENLDELFRRFLRYSDPPEQEAFAVLSVPTTFDRARFDDLMEHPRHTGYPATRRGLDALCAFEFIREVEPGRYAFHELVRDAIKAQHDPEDRDRVERHLLTRAEETLAGVTNLTITNAHRRALREGFEHARAVLAPEAFLDWYREAEQPFSHAAEWDLLHSLREAVSSFARAQLGPDHLRTFSCINNLAYLLQERGDYPAAEPLFRQVLVGRTAKLPPEHPDTLTSLNNLAYLLRLKGDFAGARPLYCRALDGRWRELGPYHRNTLGSMNNLGTLFLVCNDLDAAEPLLRCALEGREAEFGPNDPDTLQSVNNLGALFYKRGDLKAAEPLWGRALAGWEALRGADHPDTLTSVNNLAGLLQARGDLDAAEPLYRRALTGCERVYGPGHPNTRTVRDHLAALLEQRRRSDEPPA